MQDRLENVHFIFIGKPHPDLLVYNVTLKEFNEKPNDLHHILIFSLLSIVKSKPDLDQKKIFNRT